MIEYSVVYKNLSTTEKQQVFQLWKDLLSESEQKSRIDQVVVVAKYNNIIVGVTTVYMDIFPVDNQLYYCYRMYMKPEHRNRTIYRSSRNNMTSITVDFLKTYPSTPQPVGIIAAMDNPKISSKLMKTLGWSYAENTQNLPFWRYMFEKNHVQVNK